MTATVLQTAIHPDTGHVYHLIGGEDGTGISWTDAEAAANEFGGHLATISDESEYEWLIESFSDHAYLWIGLNDIEQEDTFEWSSGDEVDFENWFPGEPNNSDDGEDFVHIYNFESGNWAWNDLGDVTTFGDHSMYGIVELRFEDTEDFRDQVDSIAAGDANMNRVFDSADLVDVFQAGQYEDDTPGNSTWREGDWNGDGDFDSSDLVKAFQQNSYEVVQNRIDFPVVQRRFVDDDIGLPSNWRRKLRDINPEIRMWGTDRGVAIERRGWLQRFTENHARCKIMFDFRVDVQEVSMGANGRFGTTRAEWYSKVLTRAANGTDGLYVLVVAYVQINKDMIGARFDEAATGNTQVARERQAANQSTVIDSMPRSFILEHELGHAYQMRSAFLGAMNKVVAEHKLCKPTRPTTQHKALVDKGIAAEYARLQRLHDTGYPNNRIEAEARRRAWGTIEN